MDYEVQLAPIDKVITTPKGFFHPLCDNCLAVDCTNPIKEKTVSIAGQIEKHRYWSEKTMIRQVIACKGYIGDDASSAT